MCMKGTDKQKLLTGNLGCQGVQVPSISMHTLFWDCAVYLVFCTGEKLVGAKIGIFSHAGQEQFVEQIHVTSRIVTRVMRTSVPTIGQAMLRAILSDDPLHALAYGEVVARAVAKRAEEFLIKGRQFSRSCPRLRYRY